MDLPVRNDIKTCDLGVNCYSKDQRHFEAYSHPHLDEIYKKGRDAMSNQYIIPEELTKLAEVVQDQLKIIGANFQGSIQKDASDKSEKINVDTNAKTVQEVDTTNTTESNTKPTFDDSEKSDDEPERKFTFRDIFPVTNESGKMLKKLENAWPYNIFLTAIKDIKRTHNEPLTVTFQELFDESLGEIDSTVQITYMVDFNWLILHYALAGILDKPLLVLYGVDKTDKNVLIKEMPNLTSFEVKMPFEYGLQHAKISIISYKDGTKRLVISSANLYIMDWKNMTQALWISPKLKALPSFADVRKGESPTGFRSDFISFLYEYKCPSLRPWIERIRQTDFSEINVVFIASAPGVHSDGWRGCLYGHPRLGYALQRHCTPVSQKIPVICQSSGVGGFGPDIESWVQRDFLSSAAGDTQNTTVTNYPPLNFIYPSVANVVKGVNGFLSHAWMQYERTMHDRQQWLRKHVYQWIADTRHRTGAIPHMKTYARIDAEKKSVFWFLLTSSNFSKSAWGSYDKKSRNNPKLYIRSYEVGVLFLPKFVTGEQTFPLCESRNGVPPFPLPYDFPLTPYALDDLMYTREDAWDYITKTYNVKLVAAPKSAKNDTTKSKENEETICNETDEIRSEEEDAEIKSKESVNAESKKSEENESSKNDI